MCNGRPVKEKLKQVIFAQSFCLPLQNSYSLQPSERRFGHCLKQLIPVIWQNVRDFTFQSR